MNKYIILLRGINVSGKNKLPMQELRSMLNDLGYKNVETYIQSGNIILDTEESKNSIASKVKESIQSKFGYDVPVVIRTVEEWETTIENNPYPVNEEKKLYFTFLNEAPQNIEIEVNGAKDDEFTIWKDVVYLHCLGGYGKTKLSNNLFEKKLKVIATSRNYRTTMKLLELAKKI
ncbi:DUF1697 domain-containing protein [Pseudotenacibaculum sp. MALMAid0570]|uniref:DUF1697 domain-containing protein n=1 Tax=Pseudotenacibaculum sp. MALMAid0570 TaxID=3143938 RepID=UPI0032DFFDA4